MNNNNEITIFQRQPSNIVTNQGKEGTCYAHACSRVILNFIRWIIPNEFYPLEENDQCGNIEIITSNLESETNIQNIFNVSENCSEHNKNNILLFAYIFTLVKNEFGCRGGFINYVLYWFKKSFENSLAANFSKMEFFDTVERKIIMTKNFFDMSTNKNLFENFLNFNHAKYQIIENLLEKFKNEMKVKNLIISDYEKKDIEYIDINIIKYVLKQQLYIVFSKSNHSVTAIDYETVIDWSEEEDKDFIILKNSWGNTTNSKEFGTPHDKGKVIVELKSLIEKGYKDINFLLPEDNSRNVELDEKDKQSRIRYRFSLLPFNNSQGGRCKTKKKLLKKTISKTKHRIAKKKSKTQRHFNRKNVHK